MTSSPANPRAFNQRRMAVALWREYLEAPGFHQFDRWLAGTMKRHRQFGKRDRRAYSEVLFAAMRFGYLAAFVLWSAEQAGDWRARRERFHALVGDARALKRLWQSVDGEQFLDLVAWRYRQTPEAQWPLGELPLDAQHQSQCDALLAHMAADDDLGWRLLWHGIPLQYQEPLEARAEVSGWSPAEREAWLAQQATRPPLWLRLNHPDSREQVLAELGQVFSVEEAGEAIAVRGERGIFELDCYKSGAIEVQDLGSQLLAARVAAAPGDLVWDACAGGGGKALAIAARMQNRGAVVASDIRSDKLQETRRRAARAQFFNIRTLPWEGEQPLRLPAEAARRSGFDWVLVDAPCSSTGTWRRNPDARFRALGDDLESLTALQLRLLTLASASVRPGGHLIYGTCSWQVAENEDVVRRFLDGREGWTLQEQVLTGAPEQDADTLFVAVLARAAAPA